VKVKDLLTIEKRLLPHLPNFSIKGPLVFLQPLGDTLRGFHFESSAFSKRNFYVNVFFMPLYVPAKHLHFTFGHRVGANERWTAEQADIDLALRVEMQKEIPFLASLKTPTDVARSLESLTKPNKAGYVNPRCYEALVYALVQAGKTSAAENAIDALLRCVNPTVAWESEVASRVRLLRNRLVEGLESAREQLAAWQAETIRNLGLEPFRTNRQRAAT
jgi:hypothetical protein